MSAQKVKKMKKPNAFALKRAEGTGEKTATDACPFGPNKIPYAKIMFGLPDWKTTESVDEPGDEERHARASRSVRVRVKPKKQEERGSQWITICTHIIREGRKAMAAPTTPVTGGTCADRTTKREHTRVLALVDKLLKSAKATKSGMRGIRSR